MLFGHKNNSFNMQYPRLWGGQQQNLISLCSLTNVSGFMPFGYQLRRRIKIKRIWRSSKRIFRAFCKTYCPLQIVAPAQLFPQTF